jgi:hypothetical protein
MPERLSFADQPSPGARVLPALHPLMKVGRMAWMSAGGDSHRKQPRSFVHTMAANRADGQKQRFTFSEMKQNQGADQADRRC